MAARKTPSAGGKPDKFMRDALIVALHREAQNSEGRPTKRLYLVADKLVEKATEGDVAAIREIFDRVDGKAIQPIEADISIRDLSDDELDRRITELAKDGVFEALRGAATTDTTEEARSKLN